MKRRSKLLGRIGVLAVHCVLMAGALVMVMPMLWMLATAFKPAPEIALWPPVFLPVAPTFDNFTGAFETAPFGRFFLNSLFIAGVGTLSVIVTSLVAGTVFAKYRFPGRGLLFGMVIATAIVPFEAYMIPLYLQLVQIEWINTYQGIILPYLFMAFGIFLMRQHVGSAIPGRGSKTVVPIAAPNMTWMRTRTATTIMPSRRKNPNDRAQGASGLRAETTNAATAMMRRRSSGFVVRLAAVARPSAHAHHAPGCSHRGSAPAPTSQRALVIVARARAKRGSRLLLRQGLPAR
jgi:hypothetical protein